MNEDPNRRKKEAAAIAAGTAVGVGGVMAHNSVKKAGGYKAVGKKSYDAAKGAAEKGAGNLRASYNRTVGTPMARDNMKAKAKIAADGIVDPVKGAVKKAVAGVKNIKPKDILKKGRKLVGMSSKETKRLINLEAKLDRALDL